MHRLATVAALAAAAFAPSALAAPTALPPVKRTLTSASATDRICHSSLYNGRGIARTTYRAPMSGFVTIRGAAKRGNWDLGVFDARSRRAVTSSESFSSNEVAQTWVGAGQRIVIQGCQKSGRSPFRVTTVFVNAAPPAPEKPSLVRLKTSDDAVLDRLEAFGFDVTHSMRSDYADVIAPTTDKLALLRKLKLNFDVLSTDLREDFVKARAAEARAVKAAGRSALPSGREAYRTYAEYQTEMQQILEDHPGITRPVVLGKSYQGRDVQGIEVAENVAAKDDGRPYYLLVALHHAREWPSAETAMEFAHLITDGYGKDPQITELLGKERIVIVPIINPDGFNASRGTNPDPADTLMSNGLGMSDLVGEENALVEFDTVEGVFVPFGGNLAYRRKNCNMGLVEGDPLHSDAEQNLPCYYRVGVDPNRNYGFGWGGNGGSTDPNTQSYRGTSQWSEPETQNVWRWSQQHNVSMILTLHNVAALVLRPPGRAVDGLAPDEARLKEIGDQMADAAGYTSQYGWQLYDTTGTTEDWTYGAQGAFGYTIEIGPAGGKFHMPYQTGVVDQWTGTGAQAGRGMREALLVAAESAANPGDHSVVTGSAEPGSTLRLKKTFDTFSSPLCTWAQGNFVAREDQFYSDLNCVAPGDPVSKPDKVEYTTQVPASGQFQWHVPPSTRPFEARKVEEGQFAEEPTSTQEWKAEPADVRPDVVESEGPSAVVDNPDDKTPYATERRFEIAGDRQRITVDLSWPAQPQDFDLEIYREADGKLEQVGSSGNPAGLPESVTIDNPRAGSYIARIIYFLTGADKDPSLNDWTLTLSRFQQAPDQVTSNREEYTLTCERDGQVLETQKVYVERGQIATSAICGGSPRAAEQAAEQAAEEATGAVLGERTASINQPAQPQRRANGQAGAQSKRASKRSRCLTKAAKIKSKKSRKAAVRRCKKRYPTAAEKRAAAKRRAAVRRRGRQ